MAIKNFDVNQFTITVTGPSVSHIVSGLATGTFLSIQMDEEPFKYDSDINGEALTFDSYNKIGKATLTLHQASPSNDVFSRLYQQKELTGISATFAIQFKDNNGSTLITSPGAKVMSFNSLDYGDSSTNRVWTILMTKVTTSIGGINE